MGLFQEAERRLPADFTPYDFFPLVTSEDPGVDQLGVYLMVYQNRFW